MRVNKKQKRKEFYLRASNDAQEIEKDNCE
jgi:hypothetical protein